MSVDYDVSIDVLSNAWELNALELEGEALAGRAATGRAEVVDSHRVDIATRGRYNTRIQSAFSRGARDYFSAADSASSWNCEESRCPGVRIRNSKLDFQVVSGEHSAGQREGDINIGDLSCKLAVKCESEDCDG